MFRFCYVFFYFLVSFCIESYSPNSVALMSFKLIENSKITDFYDYFYDEIFPILHIHTFISTGTIIKTRIWLKRT